MIELWQLARITSLQKYPHSYKANLCTYKDRNKNYASTDFTVEDSKQPFSNDGKKQNKFVLTNKSYFILQYTNKM